MAGAERFFIGGDMKQVIYYETKLTFDDEDVHFWDEYKWNYATQSRHFISKEKLILHRLVMNARPGDRVFFLTRNRFDFRKSNLRLDTRAEQ